MVTSYENYEIFCRLGGYDKGFYGIEINNAETVDKAKMVLYNSYVDKAGSVHNDIENLCEELESLDQPKIFNCEYLNGLERTIKQSNKVMSNSEELLNLNAFIEEKIIICQPLSSTERVIKFKLDKKNNKAQLKTIYIADDIFDILVRKCDLDMHEVKFCWVNFPEKWKYDLMINILIQNGIENFQKMDTKSILINADNKSKILCKFNLSKLLSNSESPDVQSNNSYILR